ncbi:MAG: hypothetical protein NT062_33025 [Proteobacteria bacterium]|nr:hypothetical protein [Pseudomonadota bacterium]
MVPVLEHAMKTFAFASLVLTVAACTGGTGTAHLTAAGETELAFVDGWTVQYDHWITSIANLELADPKTEAVAFADDGHYLVDWATTTTPLAIADVDLDAARYKVSYAFVPATADATRLTTIDGGLVATMVANDWNTYFEATATKGAATVKLRWGMHNPARYQFCKNGIDDTDGIAVPDGGDATAGIFVHLDHTFWDRLGTEEAQLRFDAIGAWAVDGETALADLAQVSIANLRDRAGTTLVDERQVPLSYDDAGLGLQNLRDFITFSTSQQGHLNGEGECTVIPR